MDESAKRVYDLLPEAIEIESAYMSCAQAVKSCNGAIRKLSDPIVPKSEISPIIEKPMPYSGKSFGEAMPRIALACYIANAIALILVACFSGSEEIGYRIATAVLSPIWPVLAVLGLFTGAPSGPAFFALCLPIPAIIFFGSAICIGYKQSTFEKSERKRVEKINMDSEKQAESANKEKQRLADELNDSRKKTLKTLCEERDVLTGNLHKVEGFRDEIQKKLDLPKYFRNLRAMCGIYILLDKRRALTLEGPDGAYTQFDHDESLGRIENRIDTVATQVSGLSDTIRAGMNRVSSDLNNLERGLDGIRDAINQNADFLALKLDDNARSLKNMSGQMGQQMEISNGIKAITEYNAKVSNYENGWTSRPMVRYR